MNPIKLNENSTCAKLNPVKFRAATPSRSKTQHGKDDKASTAQPQSRSLMNKLTKNHKTKSRLQYLNVKKKASSH